MEWASDSRTADTTFLSAVEYSSIADKHINWTWIDACALVMSEKHVEVTVVLGSEKQLPLRGTRIVDSDGNTTVRFETKIINSEGQLAGRLRKVTREHGSSTGDQSSDDGSRGGGRATTSRTEPHPTPKNGSAGDGSAQDDDEDALADDIIGMWCGAESAPTSEELQLRAKLLKLHGDLLLDVCRKLGIDQTKFGEKSHRGENKKFVANRVLQERDATAVATAIREVVELYPECSAIA
jgi:hypothetical protein